VFMRAGEGVPHSEQEWDGGLRGSGHVQRRDYLERMIEQLAAVIGRILGLAGEGRVAEADRALDEAWSASLGVRRADALRFDDATLRVMLAGKTDLAAKLFEAQAAVEEVRGAPGVAQSLRRRAAGLAGTG